MGRLLAEGHEGKHVLIKGQELIGLYDNYEAAKDEGLKRYLRSGFLVHQIQEREAISWGTLWYRPCRT